MRTAVIFGGTGFIGSHFTLELLSCGIVEKVYLFDLKPVSKPYFVNGLSKYFESGQIEFQFCDVRSSICQQISIAQNSVALICNFAAVHREPGHTPKEYYETNLLGAEHICKWAETVSCTEIIFTSSIAPYGPTELSMSEDSIPVPQSPYGGSKLVAEKIHISWQNTDIRSRKLTIVRPGVVFGAGEGGNVTRLVNALLHGYFFYMGNKNTRKAGIYVKELCHAMLWVHFDSPDDTRVKLSNMTMNPGPSIQEYVDTIFTVAGIKRFVPNIPFSLLYCLSFVVEFFSKLIRVDQPINPVRIRKLVKSNNIKPQYLEKHKYTYKYSLTSSFEDWKKDHPSDWIC